MFQQYQDLKTEADMRAQMIKRNMQDTETLIDVIQKKDKEDMFGGAVKQDDEFAVSAETFKAPKTVAPKTIAKPEVIIGAPLVKGSLDREKVIKSVKVREGEIKECFKARIESNGEAGTLIVSFKLKRTGVAKEVNMTKSSLNDAALEGCVMGVFKKLVINGAKGDNTIIQPILLTRP